VAFHYIAYAKYKELADLMSKKYPLHERKIRNASHVILFCTKTSLTEEYLARIREKEKADGRFFTPEQIEQWHNSTKCLLDKHRFETNDLNHWMEKQTYFAACTMMMAAASLGVDVAPFEEFDSGKIDLMFSLPDAGLSTILIINLGYRNVELDNDMNLPKSRLPKEELFTFSRGQFAHVFPNGD
jgi:nitroreductase/dihydropteridine reductase